MARTKKQKSPIIRLTRFEIQISYLKKGNKEPPQDSIHTFYGVDTEGNERVYVELKSDEQFKKWSKTDPLWKEAQSEMIQSMLSDPGTRDVLIKTNIQAALKEGDEDMAIRLWNALSETAKAELMAKTEA